MPRPASAALAGALLLVACGSTPVSPRTPASTQSTDPHGGHIAGGSGAPGTPHPSAPEDADGVIELETDFAVGGGGVTLADALEVASSQPVLLTGFLVRDSDGGIWFCEAIVVDKPPECARPRLWVANFPADEAVFSPDNAGSTGSQTSGGVTWVPNQQLFGIVHPAP